MRRREADRTRARDVDRRAGGDPSGVGAVVAGGEDVRQHRQIEDLLHRGVLVRELEEVPVGVGHRHVLGLTADPAAHVDVAVRRAGTVGVDVEADAGIPGLAHPAPPAGDVEWDRAQVALLDELHPRAGLDHLAGDLVAEDEPLRCGRASSDHVLVRTADVGRDAFQDRRVGELATHIGGVDPRPVSELEAREIDVVDLHLPRAHVGNASVVSHLSPLSSAGYGWLHPEAIPDQLGYT